MSQHSRCWSWTKSPTCCVFPFSRRPLVFTYWLSQLSSTREHFASPSCVKSTKQACCLLLGQQSFIYICVKMLQLKDRRHTVIQTVVSWVVSFFSLFFVCVRALVNLYLIDVWCGRPINVACMLKARKKSEEREILTINWACWAIKVRLIGRLSIHWAVIILGAPLWKPFECELIDAIVLTMTVLLRYYRTRFAFPPCVNEELKGDWKRVVFQREESEREKKQTSFLCFWTVSVWSWGWMDGWMDDYRWKDCEVDTILPLLSAKQFYQQFIFGEKKKNP